MSKLKTLILGTTISVLLAGCVGNETGNQLESNIAKQCFDKNCTTEQIGEHIAIGRTTYNEAYESRLSMWKQTKVNNNFDISPYKDAKIYGLGNIKERESAKYAITKAQNVVDELHAKE